MRNASLSSSCLVHGARRRVVRWANQIHKSPPLSRSCARGSIAAGSRPRWSTSRLTTPNQRARGVPRDGFQPNEPGSKCRIAREGWCGGKRSTCPYQRTRPWAAKEEPGGCPAKARTVSLETRSRQWMPGIDRRAVLSKPSSLKERVQVRSQVSAPYSSTDRAAALYMRILVVREMDCWRHNGLRSACITFDYSARLCSILGLRSPLLVTVEPRYTNEFANSTAFHRCLEMEYQGLHQHASVWFSHSLPSSPVYVTRDRKLKGQPWVSRWHWTTAWCRQRIWDQQDGGCRKTQPGSARKPVTWGGQQRSWKGLEQLHILV